MEDKIPLNLQDTCNIGKWTSAHNNSDSQPTSTAHVDIEAHDKVIQIMRYNIKKKGGLNL
jgi:hypothetical protein